MNLSFQFGRPAAGLDVLHDSATVALTNPVVWGTGRELWATDLTDGQRCAGLTLWQHGDELWGMGTVSVDAGFEATAHQLYRDIFHATRRVNLYRVWNFIPRINDADGEIENYRAFCQGRHRAFGECFGDDGERRMSAASAVGTGSDEICAVFVAGARPVRHVENPTQVPAYRYPTRYGPKAPSFARASLVDDEGGRARLYVSGTSSIQGSESLHHGDVSAQLELALKNVDILARAAGLDGLNAHSAGDRLFRLYLRHPEEWGVVRDLLRDRLLRDGDRCCVVQADICRQELLAEVEAYVQVADAAQPV